MIASGNLKTVEIAMEMIKKGADPLDAVIEGVAIVEADPNDHSVGLGGTPNEEGVVELDAAVMHGATHGGAGVAGLRNIMHPAAVARTIMKKTRHVLLVGDNALKFAREQGFPETDLTTPETRKAWLAWKEARLRDNRFAVPLAQLDPVVRDLVEKPVHGTIHCSAIDTHGDMACVTTTSGLGYKVPGRVGDSPILGAGIYLDNTVGSCGSVGLGEVNLLNCASYLVVENLRRGMKPKDAVVAMLQARRRDDDPRPAVPRRSRPAQFQRRLLLPHQGRQVRRGAHPRPGQPGGARRRLRPDGRLRQPARLILGCTWAMVRRRLDGLGPGPPASARRSRYPDGESNEPTSISWPRRPRRA